MFDTERKEVVSVHDSFGSDEDDKDESLRITENLGPKQRLLKEYVKKNTSNFSKSSVKKISMAQDYASDIEKTVTFGEMEQQL